MSQIGMSLHVGFSDTACSTTAHHLVHFFQHGDTKEFFSKLDEMLAFVTAHKSAQCRPAAIPQ